MNSYNIFVLAWTSDHYDEYSMFESYRDYLKPCFTEYAVYSPAPPYALKAEEVIRGMLPNDRFNSKVIYDWVHREDKWGDEDTLDLLEEIEGQVQAGNYYLILNESVCTTTPCPKFNMKHFRVAR